MADVKLSYDQLNEKCNRLAQLRSDFSELTNEVTSITNSFADMWEGNVKEHFEEDYVKLARSFNETSNIMEEVTQEITNYISHMQEIDAAYGREHVSVG